MEWIDAINASLAYVEAHLADDMKPEDAARAANFSYFYLQRMFSALTETSFGEYVRGRRLSAAGQELLSPNAKVIDVALKYGYDSPESFQKAFKRFHGVTPSAAKKNGATLRCLNPLKLQIKLSGGNMMDYSVENLGKLTVIGMARRFPLDSAFARIPEFWDEFMKKGYCAISEGYLGVCFDEGGAPDFEYMIARFAKDGENAPEGFRKAEIGAQTWAKFRCVGPLPGALQKVNRQIYSEWLPGNAEYALADAPTIEMYTQGDMAADDYVSEIWLPVRRKG